MLEKVDLKYKVDKNVWETEKAEYAIKLNVIQQRIRKLGLPVIVLFEGWGASGKGMAIGQLIGDLDPRGIIVHSMKAPNVEERRFPWLKRFWDRLPAKGEIAIFDHSWYREITSARDEEDLSEKEIADRIEQIVEIEKMLSDDGYVIIKIFLHIDKKEQRERLQELESDAATKWRVSEIDWERNTHYEQYYNRFDEMLEKTSSDCAPWYPISAQRKKTTVSTMFRLVSGILESAVAEKETGVEKAFTGIRDCEIAKLLPMPKLSEVDLSGTISDEVYKTQLKKYQKRLFELHNHLYQKKIPLIIAYEGWDAAGKGGNIKRITQALDPRGYKVIPVAAPQPWEKNKHHLWRFWNALPKDGHIAIFDRTWYGRLLVEHVEGFCTQEEWGRAFDEINRFEKNLTDWGAILIKFWIQIDKDEQLARFEERMRVPEKRWKITDEDWRNREKWDEYECAVDEMLTRTHTENAPWVVVESNQKKFARIKAMRNLIAVIEKRLEEN